MSANTDVLIVGGGMVGLCMAAALLDTGLKITLLESHNFDSISQNQWLQESTVNPEQLTNRVSAISPGNQTYLSQLNIWNQIPMARRGDYQKMHVWDADGSGQITFDAAEVAVPCLGSIVENEVIRAAGFACLTNASEVTLLDNQTVTAIDAKEGHTRVELSSGETITTRLLIGADGARSSVRDFLGVDTTTSHYDQIALVTNVITEMSHEDTAWQRFTPHGPVAFLPLAEKNTSSIVWSLDTARAQQLDTDNPGLLAQQLSNAFENRLGNTQIIAPIGQFPLIKRHSLDYLSPGGVLIGDAAHTIHPLAGQGVNLGFQDVECLARVIKQQLSSGRSWFSMANLRAFERERKAHNSLVQNAMSGFKWLFGEQSVFPVLIRNVALSAVDKVPFVKQEIIRQAMGVN